MAPPKLTDQLSRNLGELRRSQRWRENAGYDDLWKRMKDLYAGKHVPTTSASDRLIVNMAFATKNVIAPSVAVNNPRFTVMARRPTDAPQAIIAEEVLNYQWRSNRYQDQFRLAVDDWLMFGHGWMKVGYKFVKEPEVKAPKDSNDDPYQIDGEGVDDREDTEGNIETESNSAVTEDRPYAERVSPEDMFVDADGRTMDDIRWIAQRIRRPVADVRVDSRYKNRTVRNNVQPTSTSRWEDTDSPPPESKLGARDTGFVDVIEWYDLKRKTYAVFTDGATDGYLINPEPMPYAFGHPFLMLVNYQVPDEFYPIGELEQIETLQLELNETRSQMINHRKRNSRKYLYMEDAFDEGAVQALESDEDNTLVAVNSGQDIGKVVIPMPTIGVQADFYNQSQLIEDDMDKVSGVSDYMRGQMPDVRRTATEAAMLQDAQQSRAADKLAKVETFLGRLGQRIIQLMQQYMTGEQVVRVVGANAMPVWITYDKDYIKGDFDFEVEAGSTQPMNETFRRQAAMQMVDAMAPFAQAGIVDGAAIAQRVLQFGFGVKDPSQFMAQQAPGGPPGAPPGTPGAPPGAPPGGPPPGPQAPPPPGPPPGMAGPAPMPAGLPPGAGAPPGGAPPGTPGAGIPPEVLQQLIQLPPEEVQALVQAGKLPPDVMPLLQQLAEQMAAGGGGPLPAPGGPPPMV